jgi:hypothetical protein
LYKDQILPIIVIADGIEALESDLAVINDEMTALVVEMNGSLNSGLNFKKLIKVVRHKLGTLEEDYLRLP